MPIEYMVKGMNRSIQKVEKSVQQMEHHTTITKAEHYQIMQAVLELGDRIKLIEMQVDMEKRDGRS